MRCTIVGATPEQIKAAGITGVKSTRSGSVAFADLSKAQIDKLSAQGFSVEPVAKVKTGAIGPVVSVPVPKTGEATYSPQELVVATGFEEMRDLTVPPLYGDGMVVAIIGTGIRRTHELVNGKVIYVKNYTTSPLGDGFDHDTGVASILLAMAPNCSIIDLKVLGTSGEGTTEEVIDAIDDCIALRDERSEFAPHMINMSLGTADMGNPNDPLRVMCREAIENGLWIAAAAGNDGPSPQTITSPACERYVFCVGSASVEPFGVSEFSSRGPTVEGLIKPDTTFFGENIEMASSGSDTARIAKSGTSFSCPFCTGIAILYIQGILQYGGVDYPTPIEGLDPSIRQLISQEQMVDVYLERICLKPDRVRPTTKDNDLGYGMPFGQLVGQAFQVGIGINIAGIIPIMIMMMMMGMMMKVVGGKE